MNPVVGLDIAKGESKGQVFLNRGMPHGKSFNIVHTSAGLDQFHDVLRSVEELTGAPPTIILESTGHYHKPITHFLDEQNYVYILVNPLIAYQAKKTSLRKVKTDARDAYSLCELYYKEEFEPYKRRGIQLLDLRNLTRQHESITGLCIQTKLQFQAILDQVFPEFRGVFGDLYSKVSLHVLSRFSTAQTVLDVSEAELAEQVAKFCPSRSDRWAAEKAKKIIAAAMRNPFREANLQSHLFSLGICTLKCSFNIKSIYPPLKTR